MIEFMFSASDCIYENKLLKDKYILNKDYQVKY